MTDNPAPVVAHIGDGVLKWGDAIIPLSMLPMPVVYFDASPSVSYLNGVVGVTLTVTGNVPIGDEKIAMCAAVVAHLKCNIPAARALRDALDICTGRRTICSDGACRSSSQGALKQSLC
jgi:hypothetical protein